MDIFHTLSSYVAVYQRVMLGNLSQNTGIPFFRCHQTFLENRPVGVPFPADLHFIRETETQLGSHGWITATNEISNYGE